MRFATLKTLVVILFVTNVQTFLLVDKSICLIYLEDLEDICLFVLIILAVKGSPPHYYMRSQHLLSIINYPFRKSGRGGVSNEQLNFPQVLL